MRRALVGTLLLLAASVLVGMGSLGGTPEGEIPKPTEDFKAQIVDRTGVSTEVSRLSMDGKVFVQGKRGAGDINVLFRNLSEIAFGALSGNEASATLRLKNGSTEQFKVEKSAMFYGDTGAGTYRITAGEVSRIIFRR